MMSAGERPVSCSRRSTQVVSTAPRTIWPSTPMFHRPAANVTSTPDGGQQQRHPGHEHVGEAGERADGALDDLPVGREGRSAGRQQDDGGEHEGQDEGAHLEPDVDPASPG